MTGIFTAAGLLAVGSPAYAQGVKVAYLNSQRIIAEAPGTDLVRTQIQQEMQRFEAQLKVLQDSVQKMFTDYQQKSVMLSPAEKTKREQELVQKRTELEQRASQLEQQAAQMQERLMKPVMDKIEKAISDLRKEEGYAIIFDVASRAMVSADTTLDLTSKVIAKLKAGSGAPTANR
jgi:outer membrane protein